MVDSLSIFVNQPLGHHQPLGTHSLGVLNLAYFFPDGLPAIDPMDEDSFSSSAASAIYRKSSSESLELASPPLPNLAFHRGSSSPESTGDQAHFSNLASSPNQQKMSSEDDFLKVNPFALSPIPDNFSSTGYISPQGLATENTFNKIASTKDLETENTSSENTSAFESLDVQRRVNTKSSTPEDIQANAAINLEDKIIFNQKFTNDTTSEEVPIKTVTPAEEESFAAYPSLGNFTTGASLSNTTELIKNSTIQKYSLSNDFNSESSWPSIIEFNPSLGLSNPSFSESAIPDNTPATLVPDGKSHSTENYISPQETNLENSLPAIISDSQEPISRQKNREESTPIIDDPSTLGSNSEVFLIQHFSSSESVNQKNVALGGVSSSISTSADVKTTILHGSEEEDIADSSLTVQENISTDQQPQIFSNSLSQNQPTSVQAIQAQNVSPTHPSTFQLQNTIGSMPGAPDHTPLSQDNLPVIIDFSTSPAPLHPQSAGDNSVIKLSNPSPEATETLPRTLTPSPSSTISLQPNPLTFEPSSPHQVQGTHEASILSSPAARSDHSNHVAPLLASINSSELEQPLVERIQRTREDHSMDPIVNVSNSKIESLNHESLTHESLTHESLTKSKDVEPAINQASIKGNDSLSSKAVSPSSRISVDHEISSQPDKIYSKNISKASDNYPEPITSISLSSTSIFLDSKSASVTDNSPYQDTQEYSERSIADPMGETSSSAEIDAESRVSINVQSSPPRSIQRTSEEISTLPPDSIVTTDQHPYKDRVFESTEKYLPEQLQPDSRANSNFSTDIDSASSSAALDAESSTRFPNNLSRQVQRACQENPIFSIETRSVLIDNDLLAEPFNNQTISSSIQSQKTAEETPNSSLSTTFELTPLAEVKVRTKQATPQLLQGAREEQVILPSSQPYISQTRDISSNALTAIETSVPECIQETQAETHAFSGETISPYGATERRRETIPNIDNLLPKIHQATNEDNSITSINRTFVPEIITSELQSLAITENASSKLIQKIDEKNPIVATDSEHSTFVSPHPNILSQNNRETLNPKLLLAKRDKELGDKDDEFAKAECSSTNIQSELPSETSPVTIYSNVKALASGQIQESDEIDPIFSDRKNDIVLQENNISTAKTVALKSEPLDCIEDASIFHTQEADEKNHLFSTETLPELGANIFTSLETSTGERAENHIQNHNLFGRDADFSMQDPHASKNSVFQLDSQTDIKDLFNQKDQTTKETESESSVNQSSMSLTSEPFSEFSSNIQGSLPSKVQKKEAEEKSALTNGLTAPIVLSPESQFSDSVQGTSSQITKNAEVIVVPEIIDSTISNTSESSSNFESQQLYNLPNSDSQDFAEANSDVSSQMEDQNPIEISSSESRLSDSIQHVNKSNFISSKNVAIVPKLDFLESENLSQFNHLNFHGIQKDDNDFPDLASSWPTDFTSLDSRVFRLFDQEQSYAQEARIYNDESQVVSSSVESAFTPESLDIGHPLCPENSSPIHVHRLREDDCSPLPKGFSESLGAGITSKAFLKPESPSADNSLEDSVSAISLIDSNILDNNTSQKQRRLENTSQEVLSPSIEVLRPESLSSSVEKTFSPDTINHENLPVIVDFTAPPELLDRKPHAKQNLVSDTFSREAIIRRDLELESLHSEIVRIDQGQDISEKSHTVQNQTHLDIPEIQLPLSGQENETGSLSFPHISLIGAHPVLFLERTLEDTGEIVPSESRYFSKQPSLENTALKSFSGSLNGLESTLDLQTIDSQASPEPVIEPQSPQGLLSNESTFTMARRTPVLQPETVLPGIAYPPEIAPNPSIPSIESAQTESPYFKAETKANSPSITSPSEVDTSLNQRLADDPDLDLPSEWQSLANLVASQRQMISMQPESLVMNRTETDLSKEAMGKSLNSSMSPQVKPSLALTDPIQRKLSVSRPKSALKFRNQPSASTRNTSNFDAYTPSFLIQAKEDTPFTTIEVGQRDSSENTDTKSWALEQIAQEIYYRMRQRLMIEKERHGRLYSKRSK